MIKLGKNERDKPASMAALDDLAELLGDTESFPNAEIISFPGTHVALDSKTGYSDLTYRIKKPDPVNRVPIDRADFVRMLDEVRQIRNDVMHFNPDTPSAGYLKPMRKLTALLQKLAPNVGGQV